MTVKAIVTAAMTIRMRMKAATAKITVIRQEKTK